jgi:hypothetical protein
MRVQVFGCPKNPSLRSKTLRQTKVDTAGTESTDKYKILLDLFFSIWYNTKVPAARKLTMRPHAKEKNMPVADTAVARFLKGLSAHSETEELTDVVSRFAETFLVAGEFGTRVVRSGDFALALPKRKQLMDALGCESSELIALRESVLGNRHVLAEARWRFVFAQRSFEVDSSYLIDTGAEEMKIVFYLAHQDVVALARANS